MKRIVAGVLCGVLALGGARAASAMQSPGEEVGLSYLAGACNIFYVPAKMIIGGLGFVTGGMLGALSGGSTRAAYAIWVPTMSGTMMLTPSHFDGTERVQFFGDDYADRPSTMNRDSEGTRIYDAIYEK